MGNINAVGGVWTLSPQDYDKWPAVEMDDAATAGTLKPAMDSAGSGGGVLCKGGFRKIGGGPPGLRRQSMLCPEGCRGPFKEAVKAIPFVVSFSSYMDETTREADVVLPSHIFLERLEDVPSGAGRGSTGDRAFKTDHRACVQHKKSR